MDKMIESTKELMEEQMPSFDFLLDEEAERNSLLAEHIWRCCLSSWFSSFILSDEAEQDC